MRKIIAIDFDGCLVENKWPEIGPPHRSVIEAAKREKENGAALILWTCRAGTHLQEAVDFCRAQGLVFDAVNDNLPEVIALYGGSNCRKVVATEYWDDHAVVMPKLFQPGLYRHFKGNLYVALFIVKHSETDEPMAVYQALYGDRQIYCRPLSMFFSKVDKEKYPDSDQEFRFERVTEEEYE